MLGTKSYMFRHQGAILRGFVKKKDYKYNMYIDASRTCPLYVFDSDLEAKVNMRRCFTNGLEKGECGNNPACIKSSELLHRNVHASWRIYKKSRSYQRAPEVECPCVTR